MPFAVLLVMVSVVSALLDVFVMAATLMKVRRGLRSPPATTTGYCLRRVPLSVNG